MENRFYLHTSDGVVKEWRVRDPVPDGWPTNCHYFGRILAEVDRAKPRAGLTFVMTWDIQRVPFAGNRTVVILVGDERHQIPAYRDAVLATFKTGGVAPHTPRMLLAEPILFVLECLRTLRNAGVLLLRSLRNRMLPTSHGNVFPIPLGYSSYREEAFRPTAKRPHDLFYAGTFGEKGVFPTPKQRSRRALLGAIGEVARLFPALRVFHPPFLPLPEYARAIGESKICLCPRGNFIETFRLFEAARAGCVIVSEPLPPLWYFRGIPAVQLASWRALPKTVRALTSDPGRLGALSAETLAWWKRGPSEEAVGRYIVSTLTALRAV